MLDAKDFLINCVKPVVEYCINEPHNHLLAIGALARLQYMPVYVFEIARERYPWLVTEFRSVTHYRQRMGQKEEALRWASDAADSLARSDRRSFAPIRLIRLENTGELVFVRHDGTSQTMRHVLMTALQAWEAELQRLLQPEVMAPFAGRVRGAWSAA